ncbi:ATP synthase subunit g, mitochondrial [Cephus cinctus]|uniref:ATP synthase subunit g n=1 Tax=Cephus cinctus TaxID=211228 RepID=A0AAJ7FTH2_CEPCN|nr:ATP synthase subunit g, mitochondrial [Cephus cinctus]
MAAKGAALIKTLITEAKPKLRVIASYAKVELVPPTPADIPAIRSGISRLIQSAKTGRYRDLTVREAWLNTLIAVEVICWFYIGECIGKRHLVGYNV